MVHVLIPFGTIVKKNYYIYEDGDLAIRPRGGVCELFRVPISGECSDRPKNWYVCSTRIELCHKQKNIEIGSRSLENARFEFSTVGIFMILLDFA